MSGAGRPPLLTLFASLLLLSAHLPHLAAKLGNERGRGAHPSIHVLTLPLKYGEYRKICLAGTAFQHFILSLKLLIFVC
jgi:hypothetical protein